MISDTCFLDNPEGLRQIYGHLPKFDEVNLQRLQFDWNGPSVLLTLDLQEFPKNPPVKWEKFNTVQVELSFGPLLSVELVKFGRGNRCNLTVSESVDGALEVVVQGETEAKLTATSAFICKISAYLNGDS
ncbi:Imm50 family immunity protein [Paraburkholderia antibiotica]|uniref:Immunity protein 50 n=1 Tax=Paraburkholderia antibiotica TaxID=2728839 RepID=A0A7Y0A0J3_9BURK|nr:Imm50 family immunity protein [Paraburkholderia antibiotica]NML34254.1 hypothetical protein [Paraburkholderia antibiotica]